ncbi:MAG: helix-turn-helix domain-containing protein [Aurantibacter sp.]
MVTILAIGAIQALFFSLILLNKKSKTWSDKILSFWLFVLFIQISANFLESSGYYDRYPHLIGSSSSLVFLYGPLLYFYAKTYVSSTWSFKKIHLLHLIPFLFYNIVFIPFYVMSASDKLYYYQEVLTTDPPVFVIVALITKTISIPVYIVWTLILLKNHGENIKNYFSSVEKIDLKWLKYLVWSMGIVAVVILLSAVIKVNTNFTMAFQSEKYIFSAASLWVFGLGYYGLKQTPVFTNVGQSNMLNEFTTTKYEKNKLKESDAESYEESLFQFMDKEQPFLRNKITLVQLASEINISTHHLSQLLNERLDQNFFNFINEYRVAEVKKRLGNPKYKNLTILGIAFDCGFNSKAAFNRIFKKHTGLTPSTYLRNQKTGEKHAT